jgi:hypothetical protein
MLHLFKLPFRAAWRSPEPDPSPDFTSGLIANYLKHKKGLTEADLERATRLANEEMEALRRKMSAPGVQDNYDLMTAALRRLDDELTH